MAYKFLAGISSLVLLFPLIISISRYKSLSNPLKAICLHVFVATGFEILSRYLWMQNQNNLFLLHLYTLWELVIISFFYLLLLKQRAVRWAIVAIMIAFALFSGLDALYMDGLKHFNTYARPVACIIIMCYAIMYLYKQLKEANALSFKKDAVLLINAVFLFYFSVSFFLFLLSNYIMRDGARSLSVWAMHTVIAFIFYSVIGLALWRADRR